MKKITSVKEKKKKNHDQMNGFLFFKLVSNTINMHKYVHHIHKFVFSLKSNLDSITNSLAIGNTKVKENPNIHVPCEFLRMPLELVSLGVP